jgi:hypothetical protein
MYKVPFHFPRIFIFLTLFDRSRAERNKNKSILLGLRFYIDEPSRISGGYAASYRTNRIAEYMRTQRLLSAERTQHHR